MATKLRPGDTFQTDVDGITYDIRVMSVGDKMDADEALAGARKLKTTSDVYRVWLDIITPNVTGWSRDEDIKQLRYHHDGETLGNLMNAVLLGNQPSEDDLKN